MELCRTSVEVKNETRLKYLTPISLVQVAQSN